MTTGFTDSQNIVWLTDIADCEIIIVERKTVGEFSSTLLIVGGWDESIITRITLSGIIVVEVFTIRNCGGTNGFVGGKLVSI